MKAKQYTNKPMDDIRRKFDKVYQTIKSLPLTIFNEEGNIPRSGNKPLFTDIEVISLLITAEYMSLDSENWLFKKLNNDYKDDFPHLIECSRFNRRKRALFPVIEQVRKQLANAFLEFEDYFIVDSMPLEICKLSREKRPKVCKEAYETSPEKGFCAAQQMYFTGINYRGFVR